MLPSSLRADIDRIWNTFWTGGLSNPLTVIEQITYLLFIKRLDELQTAKEKKAALLGTPIEAPIFTPEQKDLRWSTFKDLDPEGMFRLFTKENGVFDFMKAYGSADSAFGRFMKGAVFMIPTQRLLTAVVDMLSDIQMADRDTKGDVYEYLLSKIATAGQNGQFRTPRHIIQMMVELMRPQTTDVICDPSAGSCGFLVGAAEYLHTHHADAFHDTDFRKHFATDMFLGMEFDPTMIRIGAMNMILHGIDEPRLRDVDALSEANAAFTNKASLILANPPFTGSLDKDAVDKAILRMADSKKTELLFLALILRGLQVGGRAAVIVPDGVLFGSSKAHKQIRTELVENHRLQGVISMPSGVFKPYAGVSTAILLFTKTGTGGTDDVWFYDMTADGFSLDDKRQPVAQNDIPDVIAKWNNGQPEDGGRTAKSFTVPVADIRAQGYDLSINRYKEVVHEAVAHETPETLMAEIRALDAERAEALQELETLLLESAVELAAS